MPKFPHFSVELGITKCYRFTGLEKGTGIIFLETYMSAYRNLPTLSTNDDDV